MTEARRTRWNRALARAATRARAEAAKRLDVRLEAVDAAGLLPRDAVRGTVEDPLAFRRRFRAALPAFAARDPDPVPLARPLPRRLERLPKEVADRWHPARK